MSEKKPEARVVSEVCSMCGLDWKRHGSKPTTETCIRLLASDLAAAEARLAMRPFPYSIPLVNPVYPVYPRPYWGTITYGGQTTGNTAVGGPVYSNATVSPQMSSSAPKAVAA